MSIKIKIGIIGCSTIAKTSIIPAIIQSKYTELSFIGSRTNNRAKQFADEFNCKNFGSYDDVLSSNDVNAVYISTPIGLHEKWVIESAKAKKHILCEKSSTTSFNSAKKMVETSKNYDVRLMEGLMFKFHPSHKFVNKILNNFKTLFSFYSQYGFPPISRKNIRYSKELGGGIFNDAICYPISASRMIFKDEPTEIFTNMVFDQKSKVDTKASISLKFTKGRIAHADVGYDLEYENFYSVWGKNGSLKLTRSFNIPESMKAKIHVINNKKKITYTISPSNHFLLMFDYFANLCKNKFDHSFHEERELLLQSLIMDYGRKSAKHNKLFKIKYPKILLKD